MNGDQRDEMATKAASQVGLNAVLECFTCWKIEMKGRRIGRLLWCDAWGVLANGQLYFPGSLEDCMAKLAEAANRVSFVVTLQLTNEDKASAFADISGEKVEKLLVDSLGEFRGKVENMAVDGA